MTPSLAPPRERKAAVDPRIALRRAEVVAGHRRRWLRRALWAGVLAGLAAAAWAIAHSALLDVDDIVVHGALSTPHSDVVAASGIELGDQLVELAPRDSAERVALLPWVAFAQVERHWWDGSVTITVVERSPVGAIDSRDGAYWLVDAEAWILAPTDDPGGLPVVRGIDPPAPGGWIGPGTAPVLTVLEQLTPGVGSHVDHVLRHEDGTLDLVLRPSGTVVLGTAEEFAVQIRTLQTILAAGDLSCLATIDLRVPDTAVLTREPTCQ